MSLMFYVDDDRQMLSLLSLLRSDSEVKWKKNQDGELRRTIHTYALQLFGTLYLHYIRS